MKTRDPTLNKQNDVPTLNWYVEASRKFQNSKIALLKDQLQMANEKLNTQEVLKAEDHRTVMILTAATLPPPPVLFHLSTHILLILSLN